MSNLGKARPQQTLPVEIRRINLDIANLYGYRRTNATPVATMFPSFGGATPNVTNSQSYLKTVGDTMIGPIAFYPQLKQINGTDNSIDLGTTANYTSKYIISVTANKTLATIKNATFEGQLLILEASAADTITIKNNTGNILTSTGADFTLADGATTVLVWDNVVKSKWIQLSQGAGAGGITYPLTPPIHDYGSTSGTITLNLSASDAHVHKITLIGNATLVFSNPPASGKNEQFQIDVTQDATGGRIITWPASVNNVNGITQGTGANQRVVYVAQTSDGGTTYDVFNTDFAATITSLGLANTTLSNLSCPVSINCDLLPSSDNSKNVGSATLRWAAAWFAGIVTFYSTPLPNVSGSIDIGSSTFTWSTVWAKQVGLTATQNINFTGTRILYSATTGSTHNWQINAVALMILSASSLQMQTGINLDMNGNQVLNSTQYNFKSSGSPIYITTDGTGKIMNFFLAGSLSFDYSTDGISTGIFEIIAKATTADLKLYDNKVNAAAGDIAGRISFDANNSTTTRKTFVRLDGVAQTVTNGSETGNFELNLMKAGTLTTLYEWDTGAYYPLVNAIINLGTLANGWANLYLGNAASDPSVNGQFALNGSDVKVYSGGAVRNMTLMCQDISAYRISTASGINRWYTSPCTSGLADGIFTMAVNTIYAIPFVISKKTTIDGLGISINSNASAVNVKLGIYTDNGNNYPGTLVSGSDQTITNPPASSAQTVVGLIISAFSQGQLIWLVCAASGANLSVFSFPAGKPIPIFGTGAGLDFSDDDSFGWSQSWTYAASFPSAFPGTIATATPHDYNLPIVRARISVLV